jgi:hypothetical protein
VSSKSIILIVAMIAAVGAGWFFRDSEAVRGAASSTQAFVKDALPDNSYTVAKTDAEKSAGKADRPKSSHSLRKCVSEARTVYTDEKCPTGTREAPISEGNVTVMPGQRAGEKPKGDEKAK